MIFIDTNVFMYAVGKPHPLRPRALDFFSESLLNVETLWTSVGVLQELMDLYLPVRGYDAFQDALDMISRTGVEVWPLEEADVTLARQLHDQYPTLGARDLCHLASCRRRGVREIMTFDVTLGEAAPKPECTG